MSQPSPAKHERIQRHLMRQRGAGSRAVNADFGFSFEGFSAPASQEATPCATAIEPPPKRRKTIADDTSREQVLEPQRARGSALDRRERTKAGRARRRFVVEANEEHAAKRRGQSGGGDDSFAAGLGPRKHKKDDVTPEHQPIEKACELDAKHKAAPTRQGKKTGAVTKSKLNGKAKEIAAKADDDGKLQCVTSEDPFSTQAEPKPKKRATRKTKKDAVAQETDEGNQRPRPDPDAVTSAAASRPTRARKSTAKRAPLRHDTTVEEPETIADDNVEHISSAVETVPPLQMTTAAGKKSVSQRKGKSTKGKDVWPNAFGEERTLPHSNDDDVGKPQAAPAKPARKVTKSKPSKQPVLESTPPQLERRVLQETDANRSPSPRKSREDAGSSVESLVGKESKADGKGLKRRYAGDENAAEASRKNGKVHIERKDDVSQNKRKEKEPSSTKESSGDDSREHPPEQQLSTTKGASKRRTTKRRPDQPSKPLPKTQSDQPDVSATQKQHRDDEEDIDWLFAAPEKKSHAASQAAHATGSLTAPRKTKLADIDLDDLIANVAAFAQSGDTGRSFSVASGLDSQKGRKARRR